MRSFLRVLVIPDVEPQLLVKLVDIERRDVMGNARFVASVRYYNFIMSVLIIGHWESYLRISPRTPDSTIKVRP